MKFDAIIIGAGAAGLFCASVAGKRGKRREHRAARLQPERRRAWLARQLQHRVQVTAEHMAAWVATRRMAEHERAIVDGIAQ